MTSCKLTSSASLVLRCCNGPTGPPNTFIHPTPSEVAKPPKVVQGLGFRDTGKENRN